MAEGWVRWDDRPIESLLRGLRASVERIENPIIIGTCGWFSFVFNLPRWKRIFIGYGIFAERVRLLEYHGRRRCDRTRLA
jgi:hypothetical protein